MYGLQLGIPERRPFSTTSKLSGTMFVGPPVQGCQISSFFGAPRGVGRGVLFGSLLFLAGPADRAAAQPIDGGAAPPASASAGVSPSAPKPRLGPPPRGPARIPFEGRPPPGQTACEEGAWVCVHRSPGGVDEAAALAVLDEAVRVRRALDAAGLPRPPDDALEGGSPSFDLYVEPAAPPSSEASGPRALPDFPSVSALDGTTSFVIAPPPGEQDGCFYRSHLARAMAHASLIALDAGMERGAASIDASYFASLAVPCGVVDYDAVDRFQRAPERPLTAGHPSAPDGAFLFARYLDDVYGSGRPAGVMTSLLAVSSQRTPAGALHWHNEPDAFDALRLAARDRDMELADIMLDFAVHRAFVGSRSDGQHMSDVARYGDLGRVRFEWAVTYESLPRRLAPRRPIDATGMTYVWLDLEDAPFDGALTFVADWELPVLFRWALVRIGEDGAEDGRIVVAGPYGQTQATQSVVNLEGLKGLLIVGMNLGDISRDQPFDPDDAPHEPHGYTVTLYPQ
jgi:hypothetical protein